MRDYSGSHQRTKVRIVGIVEMKRMAFLEKLRQQSRAVQGARLEDLFYQLCTGHEASAKASQLR